MPQTALRRCLAKTKFRALPDVGEGAFEAVVSVYGVTYDVYDWFFSSKEQIAQGAFTASIASQPQVPIFWMHGWEQVPIGDGTASEQGANVIVKGQTYIDEPRALSVFRAMSAGAIREWSVAFYPLTTHAAKDPLGDPRVDDVDVVDLAELVEASSCVRGANPQTETIETLARMRKEGMLGEVDPDRLARQVLARLRGRGLLLRGAIPPHKTDTDDGAWDGPANEKNLNNSDGEAQYKQAYAWQDPDADPDKKNAYKFIHHEVDDTGKVGAANTTACSGAIGTLNGGRSGTTIPEADIQGVYDHLAGHLKDAGQDPPVLKDRARPRRRLQLDSAELGRMFALLRRGAIREEEAVEFIRTRAVYLPAPYTADADETVSCPSCGRMDDTDAIFCDQCGTLLVGRSDVGQS